MQAKIRNLAALWLISAVLLSACGPWSAPAAAPAIPGLAQTLAAQTLTAQQGGMYSPFLKTPVPPAAAQTVSMAQAPANNPQPTQAPEPEATAAGNEKVVEGAIRCINAAEFVEDVSIPDATILKGGQRFTKTWRFKNSGTCTWTKEYMVVFVWGDRMSAAEPMQLGRSVSPGESIDISIAMVAPKGENYYQGNWMFQDTLGNTFGTGYRARNFFWVAISVGGGGLGRAAGGFCGGGG